MNRRALMLCTAAAAADVLTTWACCAAAGTHAIEMNPLTRAAMELLGTVPGQLLQKAVVIPAIVLCGQILSRESGRNVALLTLAALQAGAACNNLYHLLSL